MENMLIIAIALLSIVLLLSIAGGYQSELLRNDEREDEADELSKLSAKGVLISLIFIVLLFIISIFALF